MKKKLTFLAFGLLLAVGWTNVAQAQLKAQSVLEGLTRFSPKERIDAVGLNAGHQMKAPNRAPNRATITADKTMTRAEYEAITYDWVDANNVLHTGTKLTEPASNPYQIAYLLGTTYMNKNIPGIKFSAFHEQDHPYPNIEFGWDIPNNERWPSGSGVIPTTYNDITISIPSYWIDFDYIYVQSNGTTVTGGSWTAASNGTNLPSGWGGTATLTAENNGCCTQQGGGTIIIPHSIIDGKENVTVVISARRYNNAHTGTDCTITIAGATPQSNEYTTTSYVPKTWTINPSANSGSGASGTYYPNGLTIAAGTGFAVFSSITVYAGNSNTVLTSWNPNTAISNQQYSSYTDDGQTYYYFTLPGWSCSYILDLGAIDDYSYVGYFYEEHINIPSSYLNGNSSIRVVVNAFKLDGYDGTLVVNGQEQELTTTATNYTFTITGTDAATRVVTPPDDNGYTVFLVKAKDNAGQPPHFTYSWNNDGYSNLIHYFDTYIDEVELLTDGLRVNEGTDDAGTMFSYSGELNKFYFISKGANYWFGSSEGDFWPHYSPTYDMYEEFSPTTTASGDQVTDFYSKLLYGNSYNVKHDCRGVNVMQHYFSMSGNETGEHRSMTNLIFWIPDNRGTTGQENNYDEEYLPHVGLYTITLEAEAERAADYSESNRMYDVTCDWVSSLNSILDFDVDQDYELWVYIYDDQGNPVADYMVLDSLGMQDLLIHNNTTFTYQVEQQEESQTIVYRVKGWPKDATNNPARGGDFFALSNLEPVLIPGYENFLSLGVEHYESDFALDLEHNYYRNFLTIGNQNPDNALSAKRIEEGDGAYELYRFDVAKPNELIKAADLTFSVANNKVDYSIAYANQFYVDDANVYNEYNNAYLTGYKNNYDGLGCPTSGTIANISEGGGAPVITDKYVKVTSSGDLTSGQYLIVYEIDGTSGVAFNGGLTDPAIDEANNNISVTIDNYTIPANSTTNAASFMIDVARGTVQGASGYYIGRNNASNGMLYSNTTYYTNTFSMNGTDGVIQGSGGYQLRYNSSSGQNRFRYYASTSQNAIQLYKRVNTGSDATTNTDVTVGPLNTWTTTHTTTVDGVTLTSDGDLGYNTYMRLNGTTTISTTEGTITKIVVIGSNTNNPVSRLSPANGTYAVANNVGIWTGNGASVSFTSTSYAAVTSVIVTVTKSGSGSGSGNDGFTLLNDFLDNSTYTQVGQVVFTLPWKSIQTKLQDEAGSSTGYFMIQNGGKLRFVMPAGYNNANVKFVIHNAPVSSNYYDGTFTLSSSTGATQTITIPSGGTVVDGDKDYDAIFQGISSGDVITITGTHPVVNSDNTITTYNYSPDFKYIHVYVQGGHDGVAETDALNLDAVKFVDQFKAETKEDKHPYRYGYVLKAPGSNKESDKPEIPVQHTNSTVHGYYSLNDINNDIDCEMVDPLNVMNGEVNMTLSREPEIFYYTLDRKPSNVNNAEWEAVSKLQRREDDSYQEMFTFLPQYDDQICNPPTLNTTPWIVDRFDNYDVQTGGYNAYMSYVPVIWTHGDQKNRRIKWDIENRHNSYGSPIWKTGVAEVTLLSATAERQESLSTNWTYNNEDCSLYMLNNIVAEAKMPTANNVKYVPYMFRIFVKSENGKLRGYTYVPENLDDPNTPGEHYAGAPIDNDEILCVWSGYVNDPKNVPAEGAEYGSNGVAISERVENGATVYTFEKIKVEPAQGSDWDPENKDNAVFAGLKDIIQGEDDNLTISANDLKIVVRFYYIVEGFDASMPGRGEGTDPAGYGVEDDDTPDPMTALRDVLFNATVESVTYVNTLGMTSDKPFDGVNIVITRYSNGMTTTSKVVR